MASVTSDARERDARLVVRAREGDGRAQSRLFQLHAPDLVRAMTRLLARTADADDVVQDAFVQAFRKLDTLEDGTSFRAWLYRIAVRRAQNVFRKRRLLARLGLDRGLDDALLATAAAADVSHDAREELAELDGALKGLSAELRTIWFLRYVEGLRLSDVASHTGLSLATVKRRIQRADAVLQRRLPAEMAAAFRAAKGAGHGA